MRRIAEEQHGVVSNAQAYALGLSPQQLWRISSSEGWERINPQVIRVVGAPPTAGQRALAAVLGAGTSACVTLLSAAAWWDLPGFPLDPVQVARHRNSTERGGDGSAREPRSLPSHHVTIRRAVPVTTPVRTIFDLAGSCHPLRVERALDTFWARRLVSAESLGCIVEEHARRGRPGSRLMRELLDARGEGFIPIESRLEARFVALLEDAGEEPFEHQVDLGDADGPIGRVDCLDRARRLVVEVDSDRYHTSLVDRRADAVRDARLRAVGYAVHRVREPDLIHRPAQVLRDVRDIRHSLDLRATGS